MTKICFPYNVNLFPPYQWYHEKVNMSQALEQSWAILAKHLILKIPG